MPKVSVIVPTYNRGYIVKQTINSILAQTVTDIEVLVVDDGSTDDTKQVVESIQDTRLEYLYKENGGVSSARNMGLSKIQGEYVAFLDSDDFWPKNYLEVILSHIERNNNFGAAYSAITLVYPDGHKIKSYKRPEGKSGWITLDLFKRGFIWPSASVFRSSVWRNFYFDEFLKKSYEDGDAFLRLSTHTQFLFVEDVEACYRVSDDSIADEVGVACTRILVLERFYYKLEGEKSIPLNVARRRLSHACRKVAENRRSNGMKVAALSLYKRAIRYWPTDIRLYIGLTRALLLRRANDPDPDWQMPEPLGNPIGHNRW